MGRGEGLHLGGNRGLLPEPDPGEGAVLQPDQLQLAEPGSFGTGVDGVVELEIGLAPPQVECGVQRDHRLGELIMVEAGAIGIGHQPGDRRRTLMLTGHGPAEAADVQLVGLQPQGVAGAHGDHDAGGRPRCAVGLRALRSPAT